MDEAEVRTLRLGVMELWRRMRREFHQDLPMSMVSVLGCVARGGGVATPGAIASELGMAVSNVSTTLRTLIAEELVHRVADPNDGRRQLLALTERGASVTAGDRARRENWLSTVIHSDLDDRQQAVLSEAGHILLQLARSDLDAGLDD